jgi:hypothetical protein
MAEIEDPRQPLSRLDLLILQHRMISAHQPGGITWDDLGLLMAEARRLHDSERELGEIIDRLLGISPAGPPRRES